MLYYKKLGVEGTPPPLLHLYLARLGRASHRSNRRIRAKTAACPLKGFSPFGGMPRFCPRLLLREHSRQLFSIHKTQDATEPLEGETGPSRLRASLVCVGACPRPGPFGEKPPPFCGLFIVSFSWSRPFSAAPSAAFGPAARLYTKKVCRCLLVHILTKRSS